ncbi:MAG: PHP domain-containing protein [Candidatus Hodarchaeales archaeon]
MFALDLHVHTWYSKCSNMPPQCAISAARHRKLDGIAITDHNNIKGWKALSKKRWRDIQIIPGIEVATSQGDVLGYFIEEPIRSKKYEEVVDEILDLGGYPVLAHPFDRLRKSASFPKKPLSAPHGIEVINSRCLLSRANQEAQAFAVKHGLSATGGSDAHFHSEVGNGVTFFESIDREEMLSAFFRSHLRTKGSRSPWMVHPATLLVRKARKFLRKGPLWQRR